MAERTWHDYARETMREVTRVQRYRQQLSHAWVNMAVANLDSAIVDLEAENRVYKEWAESLKEKD